MAGHAAEAPAACPLYRALSQLWRRIFCGAEFIRAMPLGALILGLVLLVSGFFGFDALYRRVGE